MKLQDIYIENFRGIRSLQLPLGGLTVLIGENNSGKSTVLEGVRLALTRVGASRRKKHFSDYDFHLKDAAATPQTAEPIGITLHFAEQPEGEWPDAVTQQLSEVVQLDRDGLNHIWLKCSGAFDPNLGTFETTVLFLNQNGNELSTKSPASINLLTRFVPLFFLSALRDASQEFGQRGQFWSGFLKSIQLPDEQRQQVEQMLEEVNSSVIAANVGLQEVTRKIGEARTLVPLDAENPVALEAVPTRVFDLVSKIQVHLRSTYGAKLPLHRYGEGTQSLAVLMLFQAFTTSNLAELYDPNASPILALEEPEAHLHPSAIRSLGSFLNRMTGQVLVTSHSGDLVSRVPLTSIRRLYKSKTGETKIGFVSAQTLSDREIQAINYHIKTTRGHYLFSRCWLLVEGESDFHLMPLLFEALGYTQDILSYSVVEVSQVIDKGEPFIKLANAFGIQWFMMADGDQAGCDYTKRASKYLEQGEFRQDRMTNLPSVDIESEFYHNGFMEFIELKVPESEKRQILNEAGLSEPNRIKRYIQSAIKRTGGKPAFAQAIAEEIGERGSQSIPESLKKVIHRVVHLAGE